MGESEFRNVLILGAVAFDENGRAAVVGRVTAQPFNAETNGEMRQFDTKDEAWWRELGVDTDAIEALPPLGSVSFPRMVAFDA